MISEEERVIDSATSSTSDNGTWIRAQNEIVRFDAVQEGVQVRQVVFNRLRLWASVTHHQA